MAELGSFCIHSVQVWTCNGGPRQQWVMDDQTQEIKLKSDGNCLDIIDWSKDNGANIYIYSCHPDKRPENQQVNVFNLLATPDMPVVNFYMVQAVS